MKLINYRLPRTNIDRLLEELEYEKNSLSSLLKMEQTHVIKDEVIQCRHMISRINSRLSKLKKSV